MNEEQPGCATAPRNFGLSDAMNLIAGAALCLAAGMPLFGLWAAEAGRLWVDFWSHHAELIADPTAFWRASHDHLRNTVWYGFQVAETFFVVLWPTYFVIRLRRPRPLLRTLLRQPGTVAGLAVIFGLFWGTGLLLTLFPERVDSMNAAAIAIGGAVATAWVILALSRGMERRAGMGRSSGAAPRMCRDRERSRRDDRLPYLSPALL
jgi:hypothetical protein